jgi:hypothetical protein|tara:strand:- start:126 stop:746 length:621 start_codon:yes stop_codon:yes gene_type:complete
MFALVESGSITKMLSGNKGVTIGDIQHPKQIFTIWTEAERNAIGIYTVEMDNSKKKDEKWYTNTNITYTFSGGKVTGSYGDATAKAHANTTWTSQDKTDGKIPEGEDVGDVAVKGLKTILIEQVKSQAEGILNKTDWYVIRKADTDEAVPSSIATHRAAVRSKQAEQETAITNASDTPALETLYTYTEQEDGSVTRPLGELPTLED